MKETNDYLI